MTIGPVQRAISWDMGVGSQPENILSAKLAFYRSRAAFPETALMRCLADRMICR